MLILSTVSEVVIGDIAYVQYPGIRQRHHESAPVW